MTAEIVLRNVEGMPVSGAAPVSGQSTDGACVRQAELRASLSDATRRYAREGGVAVFDARKNEWHDVYCYVFSGTPPVESPSSSVRRPTPASSCCAEGFSKNLRYWQKKKNKCRLILIHFFRFACARRRELA